MTTIKQRVIQQINNTIGTEFNVHSFNFSTYNQIYNVIRVLVDAGYLSRRKIANWRVVYRAQKRIPEAIDGRHNNARPSKRPYQITAYLTQENMDYLSQFKNKSKEIDRILCSVELDNVHRRYEKDTIKIRLSISKKAYSTLQCTALSSYVNEAIEKARA